MKNTLITATVLWVFFITLGLAVSKFVYPWVMLPAAILTAAILVSKNR